MPTGERQNDRHLKNDIKVGKLLIFAWLEGCWSFGWKPVVLFSATEKTRTSRETSARRLAESLLVTWLAVCWSLGWKPVGHSDDADDNHDDDDDNHDDDDVDADDDAGDRICSSTRN